MTIANLSYTHYAGPLAWCTSQGYDRDNCAAKVVSTTHPVEGSTKYNN